MITLLFTLHTLYTYTNPAIHFAYVIIILFISITYTISLLVSVWLKDTRIRLQWRLLSTVSYALHIYDNPAIDFADVVITQAHPSHIYYIPGSLSVWLNDARVH